MKKVVDTKKLLFENMKKLNPDFKEKVVLREDKKEVLTEDKKWIQKAVNPEHKGYCTPMTKPTCTPARKALAKRFKKGIDENVDKNGVYPGHTLDGREAWSVWVNNVLFKTYTDENEANNKFARLSKGAKNETYGVADPLGTNMAKPLNEI